jgi:hypothetical protein
MPALAGKPLRTRDTDAIETPARFATVTMVGRRAAFLRVNVFTWRPKTLRRWIMGVKKAAGIARDRARDRAGDAS